MSTAGADVRVASAAGAEVEEIAATIWARATDERDEPTAGRSPESLLPDLREAARSSGAVLLLARAGGRPAGFALLVPAEAGGSDDSTVELLYLAVDPASWGSGVATALLDEVTARIGVRPAQLRVLADNDRAMALYARAGWRPTGRSRDRPSDGRREACFVLPLATRRAAARDTSINR